MKSDQFLVTGAAGFTGKYLTQYLLSEGLKVRAMVRRNADAEALAALGAEPIIADLTQPETLAPAVAGITGVYHIAALFRQAGLPDSEYFDVNVSGTKNLLDACISAGVKRFIHCSTIGVLGHIDNPPADEQTEYNPGDVYQRSKVAGEQLALSYFNSGKIGGVVLRPAMIYGPGDTRMHKLFSMIARRRFFYVGSGHSSVHFVDVRDVAHAFYLAMRHTEQNGKVYIISGRVALPLKDVVSRISAMLDVPEPGLHLPVKPLQLLGSLCEALCTPLRLKPPIFRRRVDFFTKSRHFSWEKARRELGYEPSKDINEELIDIINSYILADSIPGKILAEPCRIIRSVDGSIRRWDDEAERLYGWTDSQAIGQVSHSLLQTRFPVSLEEINQQLHEKRIWLGKLFHANYRGDQVEVLSRWELTQTELGTTVLELNHRRMGASDQIVPPKLNFRTFLPGFMGSVEPFMHEFPLFG